MRLQWLHILPIISNSGHLRVAESIRKISTTRGMGSKSGGALQAMSHTMEVVITILIETLLSRTTSRHGVLYVYQCII